MKPTPSPRMGKHVCVKCLKSVKLKDYLANDFYCNSCSNKRETYPFASPSHFKLWCPKEDGLCY